MSIIYQFFRTKKIFFRNYSFMLISTLILTSCYDAVEIDNEVYALVLGIDRGTKNTLQITLQYPTYKKSGNSEGNEKPKNPYITGESITHTVEAASILQGLDLLGMSVSRRISLKHAKAMIFSEEIAKSGVRDLLTAIIRYREARQSMQIIISKDKASDFILKNATLIGDSPSKAMELMFEQSNNTAYFPRINVAQFYTSTFSEFSDAFAAYTVLHEKSQDETKANPADETKANPSDETKANPADETKANPADETKANPSDETKSLQKPIKQEEASRHTQEEDSSIIKPSKNNTPSTTKTDEDTTTKPFVPNIQFIPGKLPIDDGNKKEYIGTALFHTDKMVGVLNPDETRLLLMLNGSYKRGFITIKDHHENYATLVVDTRLGRKPKIKASILEQKPIFDIYIDIEGDILSIEAQTLQSNIDNMMDIQGQLQNYLLTEMNRLVEKIQKKYQSDALKLGLILSKRFPTISDYKAYQFSKQYPNADIRIHLTVNIRRSGLLLHTGIFN